MPASSTACLATAFVAASLSASAFVLPSFAASDGGSTSTRVPNCKKNFVYDKKLKKCVKAQKSSGLSDDNLYAAARSLAYAGRYGEALGLLDLAEAQNEPRMLTYRGFITRKLGDVEGAFPYYQAALALDADYTLAREYMGEAFLQLGQVDKAREQLVEIEKRCGTTCEEYAMLARQIASYEG